MVPSKCNLPNSTIVHDNPEAKLKDLALVDAIAVERITEEEKERSSKSVLQTSEFGKR